MPCQPQHHRTQTVFFSWLRQAGLWLAACLVAGMLPGAAGAQDAPGRVGRLNYTEGVVRSQIAGQPQWSVAEYNHPLTTHDKLWLDSGARLELSTGATTWRMEGPGRIDFTTLNDTASQIHLAQGRLQWRVRDIAAGERIEVDTANLAVVVQQPGEYRLDVLDNGSATPLTRVTVLTGSLLAYGETGASMALGPQRSWTFEGRQLAQALPPGAPLRDNLDQWAAARNQLEDQSLAARYLPRDLIGYQQLDGQGEWANDATWGLLWYPRITISQWAPYRYGQWRWVEPWGWTWIDDAPWGFAPYHYGRWVLVGTRWAWVPGRYERVRPTYAPALVGFLGTPAPRPGPGLQNPGVPWVPLAPGEAWRPSRPTSPGYVGQVNRPWNNTPQPTSNRPGANAPGGYVHERPDRISTPPSRDSSRPSQPGGALRPDAPNDMAQPMPRPTRVPGSVAPESLPQEPPRPPGTARPRPELPQQVNGMTPPVPRSDADRTWREPSPRPPQPSPAQLEQQRQEQQLRLQQQERDRLLQEQQQRRDQQIRQQQEQAYQEQLQRQQMLQREQQLQREQMLREQQQRELMQREQMQREQQMREWQQRNSELQQRMPPRSEPGPMRERPGLRPQDEPQPIGPQPTSPGQQRYKGLQAPREQGHWPGVP